MARTRTRSSGRTRGGQRRRLIWADTLISEQAITGVQGVDLLQNFRASTGGHQPVGSTVMRVLFQMNGGFTGTGSEQTGVDIGLIVESATAEGEVPAPQSEPYADWMYNTRVYIPGTVFSDQVKHDVRSKRVMGELTETLWFMMEPVLGGATNIDVVARVRVLLALP